MAALALANVRLATWAWLWGGK
eukprot:SAG11_NODE_11856_length_734_cov_19.752756_2_plen_21_part_01